MLFLNHVLRRWSGPSGTEVSEASARERAAAGAAFLDEQQPGWYEAIDVDTLQLAHGGSCVLGQLHGEFRMGLGRSAIFNLSSAPRASLSPVRLGFLCVQGVSHDAQEHDYDLLDMAWQEEIRRRLQSGAAEPALLEEEELA